MFRHILYAIFFWKLVNKTADCFNNIVFILVAKISSKKVSKEMENNSTLEKVLLVCKRKASLAVMDSRSNFWSFSQKDKKEKFDNSEKFTKKNFATFCFISLSLLTFELSNINWKCLKNCNMLTERTYDSVVFKIFLNIKTICIFIEQ